MGENLFAGSIDDQAIEHKLRPICLRPYMVNVTEAYVSLAASAPVIGHDGLATSEQSAMICSAADEFFFGIDMAELWDINLNEPLLADILFGSGAGNATLGVGFTLDLKGFADDTPIINAGTSPDGTATWTSEKCAAVADTMKVTTRKHALAAGTLATFTDTTFPTRRVTEDVFLGAQLTCDSVGDDSADGVYVYGVRIWGVREITHYSGARQGT